MRAAVRRTVPAGVAVLACATAASGCGKSAPGSKPSADQGPDAQQIRAVVDRLGAAGRARDGKTICHELLTHGLKLSIQRASHTTCSAAVVRNIGGPKTRFRTGSVVVKGPYGLAEVTDQAGRVSHLIMQKSQNVWRIARIGR